MHLNLWDYFRFYFCFFIREGVVILEVYQVYSVNWH